MASSEFYDERNYGRYLHRLRESLIKRAARNFGAVNISELMEDEREMVAQDILDNDELRHYYSSWDFSHDVDSSLYGFVYELIREGTAEAYQDGDYRFIFIANYLIETNPARATELQSISYAEYLETEEWQARRRGAVERDNHRCQVCGSGQRLHVHHKTYERRGNERLGDLLALCSECHASVHGLKVVK